jgi:hypothetical protein
MMHISGSNVPEAGPALDKVAAVLKSYPMAAVLIDGHSDGKGDDQYDQRLSKLRSVGRIPPPLTDSTMHLRWFRVSRRRKGRWRFFRH